MKTKKRLISAVLAGALTISALGICASATGFTKGDVNFDGTVNENDATIVYNYIYSGSALTIDQVSRADVVADNVINYQDLLAIHKMIDFPMGDVNLDGEITYDDVTLINRYMAGLDTFDNVQLYLADITQDGTVNNIDGLAIVKKISFAGDVNGDSSVTVADVLLINQYVAGTATLSAPAIYIGDMNNDHVLDNSDAQAIMTLIGQ